MPKEKQIISGVCSLVTPTLWSLAETYRLEGAFLDVYFARNRFFNTVLMSQLLSLDFDADKTFAVQLIKPDK